LPCDPPTVVGGSRLSAAFVAYRTVFSNRDLRRVQVAYAASISAEWAAFVALAVFAYGVGGARHVALVGVIRMLPAALATPFAALAGDRFRRERVLALLTAASAGALTASAVVFFSFRAEWPIYVLAGLLAVLTTLSGPTLTALLPSLARTPKELVASNGTASTTESLGTLMGSLCAGVVVAVADPGTVFALGAGTYALAAVAVLGVRTAGWQAPAASARARDIAREFLAGFEVVARNGHPRLVVALFGAQTVVRGALNVLIVVLAFRVLGSGESWVGFLAAALGAGGLVGAMWALSLTGERLAALFGVGLLLWGLPIALLAAWPHEISALVLLGLVGVGNSLEDVAGITLLQRLVSDEVLARVLGVLWGLSMAGAAVGFALAPPLVDGLGPRGALVAVGLALVVVVALAWSRLAAVDRTARAPLDELALLADVPMFSPLSLAAKERLGRGLVRVEVPAGAEAITEGDHGDRFYIVAEGEADVTQAGEYRCMHGPGDFFGEIALLRDVPRTATVTARTPLRLCALDRDSFLDALSWHAAGTESGNAIAEERLARRRDVPRDVPPRT
jgi:Cyclic nucleotide-binding domain